MQDFLSMYTRILLYYRSTSCIPHMDTYYRNRNLQENSQEI